MSSHTQTNRVLYVQYISGYFPSLICQQELAFFRLINFMSSSLLISTVSALVSLLPYRFSFSFVCRSVVNALSRIISYMQSLVAYCSFWRTISVSFVGIIIIVSLNSFIIMKLASSIVNDWRISCNSWILCVCLLLNFAFVCFVLIE